MATPRGLKPHRGWELEGVGGFITVRHWWATKGDRIFCGYKLREVKEKIDGLEDGTLAWGDIPECFKKAQYI